jgi:hypothetical protein
MAPLTDARGCLTEAGLDTVESAPLGRAPAELSAHVASCPRCQERLLLRSAGASVRSAARKPPPPWRIVVLLAALLLAAVGLLGVFGLAR